MKSLSKYDIIVTALIVLLILGAVLVSINPRFKFLKRGDTVVRSELYDSLLAIVQRPPVVRIDTIRDTVPGKPVIRWKDKLIPVYLDSLSAVYRDTLSTKNFKVVTTDTLQWNRIKYRKYDYTTYVDTILKYIEVEKPVFVDRDKPIPKSGRYYGASIQYTKSGMIFSGDLFYITKKDLYYGISGGVFANTGTTMTYSPIIGIKVGRKF